MPSTSLADKNLAWSIFDARIRVAVSTPAASERPRALSPRRHLHQSVLALVPVRQDDATFNCAEWIRLGRTRHGAGVLDWGLIKRAASDYVRTEEAREAIRRGLEVPAGDI
ncbi:MAG: hypothetical protein M1826_003611 [Phylliscum demangeonii]|nr:MAG: hypothetical protein M1826_003611 [Phylliscum demangeonii]